MMAVLNPLQAADAAQRAGDLPRAVELLHRALQQNPADAAAWNNLGNLFATLHDLPTAIAFLQRASALDPTNPHILSNLAAALTAAARYPEALAPLHRALSLDSCNPLHHNRLTHLHLVTGDLAAAETALQASLTLAPIHPEALANLAFLRFLQARLPESEAAYRTALALRPHDAALHDAFAKILLAQGKLAEGWPELEWRWRSPTFPSPRRPFAQPQWTGEQDLAGQTILLHAEQGLGDTLQFLRYVPLVAALAGRVLLELHAPLLRLAKSLPCEVELLAQGDPIPAFDLHCPLLSLPLAFGTTLDSIPNATPYLAAPTPVSAWLPQSTGQPRIALVWAGNPTNLADARRSIPFADLRPLLQVPGLAFFSFQRGPAAETSPYFVAQLPSTGDLADTAAALRHMDLVLTVDTSVAHLAGSLGLPVWILLPRAADWRWLQDTGHSPWYPTATLFRQNADNAWPSVLQQVIAALRHRFALP